MTLQQLRYFLTVCETGSITLAADILFVSQPAVSKSLRELESDWGVQLFTRRRQRLEITESGKAAYDRAQRLLAMSDAFENDMRAMGTQKNSVSVVMNSSMAILLYPTLINAFKKAHPEIRVHLIETKEHANMRLKNDPEADVLLMANARQHLEPEKYDCVHLLDTEYVVLTGVDTPLAGLEKITPDIRADRPVISDFYPRDLYGDRFIPKRLAGFLNGASIQIQSGQFLLNIESIRDGEAYGYSFREVANRYDGIRGIPLDPPWIQSIHAYYPHIKKNSAALKTFLDFAAHFDYAQL